MCLASIRNAAGSPLPAPYSEAKDAHGPILVGMEGKGVGAHSDSNIGRLADRWNSCKRGNTWSGCDDKSKSPMCCL